MIAGPRAGTNFLLPAGEEVTIGRGGECVVQMTDALASRIHAVLTERDGLWCVRDAGSRNGTYVNGQKVDEAALGEGHVVRIGATEFEFHQSDQPPTVSGAIDLNLTQTIIRNASVGDQDAHLLALSAIADVEQAQDLLLLYQLSIKLLGADETNSVLNTALELVRVRTGASLAGFLWISDEGQFKTKLVLPESAGGRELALSQALSRLVSEERQAVWVADQSSASSDETLKHYADAVCVPLVHSGRVLGAIHAYLGRGRFTQAHFEFVISIANITAQALVRARMDESRRADLSRLQERSGVFDELLGDSKPMRDLKEKIARMARAGGAVLIRGESGAGKELVARALHRASPRADRPLLSVNCAAIPGELMESQLFGHAPGAFTGAEREHRGFFQQADTGTLFLDEIGELTLQGQSKLLRILEGHPFLPVGSTKEMRVDVRVIAATNRDLLSYVREKQFREDLYYRLSVFELHVPPLRERGDDVGLLVDHYAAHFSRQHGRPNLRLSEAARAKLLEYRWPGNVRQLRNVIDSAAVLAAGPLIEPGDLGLRDAAGEELDTLDLAQWERRLMQKALERTNHNVPEAARLLGVGRATLYRKIEEYGLRK
jgi:Nif-specific regulatory protein